MTLQLKGKNGKGKNRIREHGEQWEVSQERAVVLFSDQPGPWFLVCSLKDQHARWIHSTNDKDFVVLQPIHEKPNA